MIKKIFFLCIVLLAFNFNGYAQDFKFAFLTDMHIHNDASLNSVDSLIKTLPTDAELLITGGDNVDIDNLKQEHLGLGEARYKKLAEVLKKSAKKHYLAIGNHDRLPGHTRDGKNDYRFFENQFGKTYYAFEHKGWKFIVLNSVEIANNHYNINDAQLNWLTKELAATAKDQPVAVISHVPFLSVYYPVLEGKYTDTDTFKNQKTVFDMFSQHNLKLVLQGHMHLYEEIKVKDVQFITAGAVSGNWWAGDYHGTKPGYLMVEVKGNDFKWEYIK